jgi:hypothetical protein
MCEFGDERNRLYNIRPDPVVFSLLRKGFLAYQLNDESNYPKDCADQERITKRYAVKDPPVFRGRGPTRLPTRDGYVIE